MNKSVYIVSYQPDPCSPVNRRVISVFSSLEDARVLMLALPVEARPALEVAPFCPHNDKRR